MKKRNRSRVKKLRNMILVCTFIALVLSVSTYAWFIGMRTVNVSSFDVEIASTDSLLLSLDGDHWDTTVDISSTTYNTASYVGNTNWWAGNGLIPMSTVGAIDTDYSRLILYEKASLTTTAGGYRLMASRVNNYGAGISEQNGYVAFDLFVRNFSGNQYIQALNELDEEAIYLTTNSAVTVAADGVANTGIENSVRVAFAQIGRVSGFTTDVPTITGITCATDATVTGICRTAQIWEPNDTDHTTNAISWYDTSCVARTGANVTLDASYSGDCGTVANGTAYPTYAISTAISSADNVDVYDGLEYNTYTSSAKLFAYPYFTDTMKDLTGTDRPTFITLAPNSITKVRVYIYIEGQDVDNYDYASIGKKIAVNFGLTKERFIDTDINYTGPDLGPIEDVTKPVITLLGDETVNVTLGEAYTDAGATALDDVDGDITSDIVVVNPVNVNEAGTYTVTYNVTDWNNNSAVEVTRTVIVQ
ncbi:MAG: DUF5011 domain-containing protein [Bacilli bacterium]|nr:DUF5011 domain-containing protein [Bacilli bacterium]